MKHYLIYILFFCTIYSSLQVIENDYSNHLELFVHEDIINKFLLSFGNIEGIGSIGILDYSWVLSNLNIDISEDKSEFSADIKLKSSNFERTDKVIGDVIIEYNESENMIYVKIVQVDFNIDLADVINIIPKESVKIHIDLSKYFKEAIQISGPQPQSMSYKIDVTDSSQKKIKINIIDSKLFLIENGVKIFSVYESFAE
tara:strand:- start:213 stop:812 length:600 start_codon:yes stop_codon:yes gene_type:complete